MPYELDLVLELATELGLDASQRSPTELALDLGAGAVLMFVNDANDEHSLIGFDDESGWHYHGDFGSVDPRGYYVDLDYLAVVSGLADGTVLVCERWRGAQRATRAFAFFGLVDAPASRHHVAVRA